MKAFHKSNALDWLSESTTEWRNRCAEMEKVEVGGSNIIGPQKWMVLSHNGSEDHAWHKPNHIYQNLFCLISHLFNQACVIKSTVKEALKWTFLQVQLPICMCSQLASHQQLDSWQKNRNKLVHDCMIQTKITLTSRNSWFLGRVLYPPIPGSLYS